MQVVRSHARQVSCSMDFSQVGAASQVDEVVLHHDIDGPPQYTSDLIDPLHLCALHMYFSLLYIYML